MYVCLECNCIFDEAKHYTETHGLPYPPYEEWYGCPVCGGTYVDAINCDYCGLCVTGEYIKLNDNTIVCENCYEVKNIEDLG